MEGDHPVDILLRDLLLTKVKERVMERVRPHDAFSLLVELYKAVPNILFVLH